MENEKALKSGEFLVRTVNPATIFIPEQFDEEQKMIARPMSIPTWFSLKRATGY